MSAIHAGVVAILITVLMRGNRLYSGAAIVFLLVGEIVLGLWLRRQPKLRLVVDRRGLHRVRAGVVLRTVLWPEVVGFKNSKIDGGLLVQIRGGKTVALCRVAKLAKSCRTDIERAWHEHLTADREKHSG